MQTVPKALLQRRHPWQIANSTCVRGDESLEAGCLLACAFSRMRSRRVPVLKLGSRCPGGDQKSLRLCSSSVRECRRVSRIVGSRKSSQNTELSSLFTFSVPKVSTVTGIGGVLGAKGRTVVTFGLVSSLRVSKVSTVTGIGGVVVAKRRTVVTFGLVSSLRVSKVSTVTGIGGVVVAKRRTVVAFGLVLRLRVSKVSTVTGSAGSWSRNAELSSLLDSSRLFASQKCQQSQGSGGSWSRNAELSSLLPLPLE